jgi:hypothetical protein
VRIVQVADKHSTHISEDAAPANARERAMNEHQVRDQVRHQTPH